MEWAGHVARMVRGEVDKWVWYRNLSDRDHLEELGVDGSIC